MKKIFVFVMAAVLCLGLAACGGDGGETKEVKNYDLTDDTGIINIDLTDTFEKENQSLNEDHTSLDLSSNSENHHGWNYIYSVVLYETIYDYTLERNVDTLESYIYAEDLTTEKVEIMGKEGYKVEYVDGNDQDGKMYTIFVMEHKLGENDGDPGYIGIIRCNYYPDDKEKVMAQVEKIVFNWDADYDFGVEEEDAE